MARFQEFFQNVRTSTTVTLFLCIAVTIGLFIGSFFAPPKGEINKTVLHAATILFAFASLSVLREAIREGTGARLTHGSTTLEIKDLDGPDRRGREQRNKPHDDGEF